MLKRWTILVALGLLLTGCANKPPLYSGRTDHVRAAREAWRENDLDGAAAHFEKALLADPDDADAHACMAETLRRQEDFAAAEEQARRALALDPDHAFATAVLGDLFNPQFKGHSLVQDRNASIRMYRAALDLDPYDPQALLGLCTWMIRQGDRENADICLRSMGTSDLWSDSIVALARWTLESAPPDAILLLNGDADAFPIWLLQESGVRTDVLPCHVSLLNLEDYRGVLGELGLPLPEGPLNHLRLSDGTLNIISAQVIRHLFDLHREETLGRPLAISLTVPGSNLPENAFDVSHLRGGVLLPVAAQQGTEVDIEATRPLMEYVPPRLVAGTWITPRERSPIRLHTGGHLRYNPMKLAVRAFRAALQADDMEMAASYRELYLAYRKELGELPRSDELFELADTVYQGLLR